MSEHIKIGCTFLSLLAFLILPWLFYVLFKTCSAISPEKEIHLIPAQHRGDVYIFFNQPDGSLEKYSSNGERIYEIPNSGILKTKFQLNIGECNIVGQQLNGEHFMALDIKKIL